MNIQSKVLETEKGFIYSVTINGIEFTRRSQVKYEYVIIMTTPEDGSFITGYRKDFEGAKMEIKRWSHLGACFSYKL